MVPHPTLLTLLFSTPITAYLTYPLSKEPSSQYSSTLTCSVHFRPSQLWSGSIQWHISIYGIPTSSQAAYMWRHIDHIQALADCGSLLLDSGKEPQVGPSVSPLQALQALQATDPM